MRLILRPAVFVLVWVSMRISVLLKTGRDHDS